jgi:hypothetical protein
MKRSGQMACPVAARAVAAGAMAAVLLSGASSARAGGERWIGALSTATLAAPDRDGRLGRAGSGGSLTLMWLEECSGRTLCGALESSALFLFGRGGERLYDLSASLVGSAPGIDSALAPFLAVGLDVAAAAVLDQGRLARGVTAGVHGDVGVHALLGDRLYLRGQIGWIGAGAGGVKGELAIGYRFD